VILIDADILVYRIGWSCNEEAEKTAISTIDGFISDILLQLNVDEETDYYVLYLTGKGNFRKEYAVTAEYKGNRKDKAKPVHIQALRQHLIDKWAAVVTEGEEADDLISLAVTQEGPTSCVASIDKDMHQLHCWHYNFVKRQWKFVEEFDDLIYFLFFDEHREFKVVLETELSRVFVSQFHKFYNDVCYECSLFFIRFPCFFEKSRVF
jgi:5'-3' exonuclease